MTQANIHGEQASAVPTTRGRANCMHARVRVQATHRQLGNGTPTSNGPQNIQYSSNKEKKKAAAGSLSPWEYTARCSSMGHIKQATEQQDVTEMAVAMYLIKLTIL